MRLIAEDYEADLYMWSILRESTVTINDQVLQVHSWEQLSSGGIIAHLTPFAPGYL